jgi:hypothetical protein
MTPLGSIVGAYDAEVANELETALDAQLLVPNKLPVIPPVASLSEPVISVSPITRNSTGALLDSINEPVMV